MRARILAAAALVLAIGMTSRADDKPLERSDVDKRVVKTVYDTALLGTDIFNKGNLEGCFRLYQGTLMGILPMLDHRPKLMVSVKEKMDKARLLKGAEGAFVLREALDEIQNEIAPSPKPDPKKSTLWERLGGEKVVRSVVHDLLGTAIEDKKVNFTRDGKYKLDAKGFANLEQHFVETVSAGTGGPLKYSGTRELAEVHKPMKITDAEYDAFIDILKKSLEKNKVAKADADELLQIFDSKVIRSQFVEEKKKGM